MNMTQFLQGVLYASAGLLLLLYTMDYLVYGVGLILTILAIGLILYGFQMMGAYRFIMHYVNKYRKSSAGPTSPKSSAPQAQESSSEGKADKSSKGQQTAKSKSSKSGSKSSS